MPLVFERVVIAGVGLIGGSFAAALKAAGVARHVVGVGRSAASLEQAKALGLIDEIQSDWAIALKGADLLLLAMPVGQMHNVMAALAPPSRSTYAGDGRRQHQGRCHRGDLHASGRTHRTRRARTPDCRCGEEWPGGGYR